MKVKTAVIGCGIISEIYLYNTMTIYKTLDLAYCSDINETAAHARAKQFHLIAADYEDILKDESIKLIIILTPPPSHFELAKKALEAGKCVYTEKPLTGTLEEAKELIALAKEKRLLIGSAPETFMGNCFQTARKALDQDMIGDVTAFSISANRDTDCAAALFRFLRKSGGDICSDYGIYYLTALVSLLGPVDKVFAYTSNLKVERVNPYPGHPEEGEKYIYNNESQINAVIKLKSGITGNFALNGESNLSDVGLFYIYGTKGILKLGNANQFGCSCEIIPNDYSILKDRKIIKPEPLEDVSELKMNCRGIGPSEMGWAIVMGQKPVMNIDFSYHVLETVHAIRTSGKENREVEVKSDCSVPRAFNNWNEIIS